MNFRPLPVLVISLLSLLQVSCRKDRQPSGRELMGVWVNSQHRADTLVVTREAGGLVLFDNSMAYRSHPRAAEIRNAYKWYVRLDEDGIGIAFYKQPALWPDFNAYPFEWLEPGQRFQVESLAFRPWVSCWGCKLEYERVR